MCSRIAALMLLVCLWTCGTAFGQDEVGAPTIDLPVFPGGEPTLEINLTREDLLTTLEAALPMLGGWFTLPEDMKAEDVAGVFENLRRIQLMQVEVEKPGVSESDVAGFYAKNLPEGKWSRVFWQSSGPTGTMAIYVRDNGEGIYGMRVNTVKNGESQVRRALIAKTEGRVDLARLLGIAARVFSASRKA